MTHGSESAGPGSEPRGDRSEERLGVLAAAAFDGILISQDGTIVEVNDQLAALLGCERADLIGAHELSFVAPEDRERVASATRSGLDEACEHLALRKDGSRIAVEVRGKTIRLGAREARVSVVRDVSGRRRLEDAVCAIVAGTSAVGVEFFAALTRAVAGALGVRWALVAELVASPEGAGRASFARARSVALWADGRLAPSVEYALAGTPCADVLRRGMCHYLDGVREQFPEDELLAELGARAYLGVPLLASSGEPLGLLVALHDRPLAHSELAKAVFSIFAGRAAAEMERLRADAALRSSEACLRATIDSAPHVAIQWYDAEGRVLMWNKASEKLFGWAAAEALGEPLDRLIARVDDGPGFAERIAMILRTNQPSEPFEYRFRRRDGTEGICLSTTFRISDGERGPRVACMDVDITARRSAEQREAALEEQLQHAQQLGALGTFAGGIAHDFNNILTAIFAYAELALAHLGEPARAREHLAELQDAAARARELVRQILSFSRRQTQARAPVRLQLILEDALKFLRSSLPSTIQIESAIDWGAPLVLASPIQMYQVVLNLSMNAAHAMRGAVGVLRLRLDVVTLGAGREGVAAELGPGLYLRLVVQDTGHGMDAATLSRVFEPFFTTKPPGEGTGLGLSVVRSIVHEHHGSVRATSEVGQGSTFEVLLPAQVESESRRDDRPSTRAPGRGERVMLVDDESSLCEASRAVLDGSGYRVAAFTDPRRALEAFTQAPYEVDIAITDLTMPNMTGTELARRLHALRPELPVVLISGAAGSVEPAELASLGVKAFVPKPFKPSELAATVRRTLDAGVGATGL